MERAERLILALVAAGGCPVAEVEDALERVEASLTGDPTVPSDPLIARIHKQLEAA